MRQKEEKTIKDNLTELKGRIFLVDLFVSENSLTSIVPVIKNAK